MNYSSLSLFRFFIGYWILQRGWISILAPFFLLIVKRLDILFLYLWSRGVAFVEVFPNQFSFRFSHNSGYIFLPCFFDPVNRFKRFQ